jgi:hypothetical protein
MVAQQAVLAAATSRTRRAGSGGRATSEAPTVQASPARTAGSLLPSAVADRLFRLLDGDPAFAEAVTAHLPAARQQSASDLAAYTSHYAPSAARRLDTVG